MRKNYASVWDAIEDDPRVAENLKLRSSLMMKLAAHIRKSGMTQAQAARALGVSQPRISDLKRGRIELFAIDGLINMLASAGLRVEMKVRKAA
jgi:predicted XRE-type DNA-binding protein